MYTKEDNNKDRRRFKLLMEYDFYATEDNEEEEDLLMDSPSMRNPVPAGLEEDDEEENGEEEVDADVDMDLDVDAEGGEMGDEEMGDEEMGDEEMGDEEMGGEEMPDMEGEPEMEEPMPEAEPMEDEVELDVTDLVQGTEEAKESAEAVNNKVDALLSRFDNLSKHLDKMSAISDKIEDLENEVERRNPTPEEKLEMRSLSSYPYNLKLTDFWSEKEGRYDVMNNDNDEQEEYVLTQDDVERTYNASEIKDSFGDDDHTSSNVF